MVALFTAGEPKNGSFMFGSRPTLSRVVEAGRLMDFLQALLDKHKDEFVPVPQPQRAKAQPSEYTVASESRFDSNPESPDHVDISAEESCPAPSPPTPVVAPQREPAVEAPQAPSATTFELMNELDALAQDLAAKNRTLSEQSEPPHQDSEGAPHQHNENVQDEAGISPVLPAPEPSIRVSRPSSFADNPFSRDRAWSGKRTVFTLATAAAVALIGIGATVAWQSYGISTAKPQNDENAAAARVAPVAQTTTPSPQPAPVAQTAPAPIAPELAKQLEALAQDVALVRRSVEQLTAKQEQLAAMQQQLEQLTAKQGQLAAKQEQLSQNIAKLQPREQNVRQRISAPPRPAPVPPHVAAEPPPRQLSSAPAPRAEPHPLPPLPVPQQ